MAANKLSGVPQDSLRGLHQLITLHFNDNNLTRSEFIVKMEKKYKPLDTLMSSVSSVSFFLKILGLNIFINPSGWMRTHLRSLVNTFRICGFKIISRNTCFYHPMLNFKFVLEYRR